MTHEEFNNLIIAELAKIKATLVDKGHEYCFSNDRLDCFRKAAEINSTTVTKAVAGMMVKHTVSIYDYLNSDKVYTEAQYLEKITDNLSYLLILWAALHEDGNMDCSKSLNKQQMQKVKSVAKHKILLEEKK